MNNGKVRIYELSRELNLDNKDILGICDQLNIAVKSHSSTITESEAERIRSQAGKYSAQQASARRPPERSERKSGVPSPVPNRHNAQNKQQILEIKHQSSSGSSSQQSGSTATNPPQLLSSQNSASPMKQTTLNRPMRVSQQDAQPTDPIEPTHKEEAQPSKSEKEVPVEEKLNAVEPVNRPVVAEPPTRPASAPVETRQPAPPQPAMVERPVLKRARVDQSSGSARVTPPEAKSSAAKKPTHAEPSVQNRQSDAGQPVPELQRPQRKVRNTTVETPALRDPQKPTVVKRVPVGVQARDELASGSPSIIDDKVALEPDTSIVELRRPTPPRPPVRDRKNKNEEPEDDLETAKASKVGRRQPRQIIDDDEEFEDLEEELPETVVVSLSVARPPKPKGRPGQPVAAASSLSATKGKKPGVRGASEAAQGKDKGRGREQNAANERPEKVVLTGSMTVRELAEALAVPETEIIKKLFFKGMAVNITQTLDIDTARVVAEELGVQVETAEEESDTGQTTWIGEEDLEYLQRRPPVVTIMGHVDHGKTSLLDAIRETKVAQGEAGGITQHIGAYHVDVEHEGKQEQIVFLDTPGHEAFTAMRARGARVTDIAVLVVAADDGVRPQTVEAISHAKAAEVPIVVAINKIDKPEAQPDRVKQELTEYGLVPEEWGGDNIMVPVSALQRENLDTLLEMILLVAEVDEELVANPEAKAKGTVIEANLDKARGPVATLLVQNGTLRVGDSLVAGSVFGKVRAMIDDRGKRVESAGPSRPVEVLGLSNVPAAGDEFEVFENEKEARATAQERSSEQRQSRLQQVMASRRVSLNSLSAQAQEGELKELNLILKADVQGSVEAILGSLKQLPQNEVQVRVLLAAPGEITETDVDLAAASGAVIVGFNTTLASGARASADEAAVDVREYNIIYKLLDDIQGAMEGLLEPEQVEESLGQVEVRAVFPVGRGSVAGCYVLSGKVIRNCKTRVRRNSKVVYEGSIDSLKRMKEDVKEVNAGFECGIGIDKFNDWAEGDIIETYQMVSKRRTLSLH